MRKPAVLVCTLGILEIRQDLQPLQSLQSPTGLPCCIFYTTPLSGVRCTVLPHTISPRKDRSQAIRGAHGHGKMSFDPCPMTQGVADENSLQSATLNVRSLLTSASCSSLVLSLLCLAWTRQQQVHRAAESPKVRHKSLLLLR